MIDRIASALLRRTVREEGAKRVAVIDIGSNSVRLVVYDRLKRAPVPLFNEKILCALGRDLKRTGRLHPDGKRRALEALQRFAALLSGMDVADVQAVATAAVRSAEDGPAFKEEIERTTGLTVTVLSGPEEARMSGLGVRSGMWQRDGLVGDLGGGSLELVEVTGTELSQHVTLPLGPLSLLSDSGDSGAQEKTIQKELDKLPWLKKLRGRVFIPVGGNWRAIAKLHMVATDYPLRIIDQYTVPGPVLGAFAAQIGRMSAAQVAAMPGAATKRADLIPVAARTMAAVLKVLEPREVVFSAQGLREGLLFERLSAEQQALDPLLYACMGLSESHGRFLAEDALSPWLRPLLDDVGAELQRLVDAACLLSDIAWNEHPDYRADHAYWRVLRGMLLGADHAERGFLAIAVYLRYGSDGNDLLLGQLKGTMSPKTMRWAMAVGHALRLAYTLTGGVLGRLEHLPIARDGGNLVLTIPPGDRDLTGEVLRRHFDKLAKSLDLKPVISLSK